MASLNMCQFIGNLGKDPEMRYTDNGTPVCSFSIACTETWKDKATKEKQERTEWVRCIAWRELAEICNQYLKKGKQVYVSGRMQTREWVKDDVKRYTTEVQLDTMKMLGKADGNGQRAFQDDDDAPRAANGGTAQIDDDDLPF